MQNSLKDTSVGVFVFNIVAGPKNLQNLILFHRSCKKMEAKFFYCGGTILTSNHWCTCIFYCATYDKIQAFCNNYSCSYSQLTTQKMKFFIKDFFSNCNQIRSYLRMWSYWLKKSLTENFTFCAVTGKPECNLPVSFYCREL